MVRISKKKEDTGGVLIAKTNATKQVIKVAGKKKSPTKQISKKFTGMKLVLQKSPARKEPKIQIADNTTIVKRVEVAKRMPLAVLIPSPLRFPVPFENKMGSIARYAGVFFVLVGSLFSLVHLESATGEFVANVHKGNQSAEIVSSVIDTSTSGAFVDTTPDVRISVTPSSDLQTLLFMITVPSAESIKIVAEENNSRTLIVVGHAQRLDNSTWKYYWSTTNFPAGEYKVRAIVTNVYGTYEYTDSAIHTINPTNTNTADTTGTPTTTTNQIIEAINSAVTTDTGTVAILNQFGDAILRQSIPLTIFAANAADVKVYARNTKTLNLYYIGYAIQQSESEWSAEWDTTKLSDGTYQLQAKAHIQGKEVVSATTKAVVDNIDVQATVAPTTDPKAVPESNTSILNPTIKIDIGTNRSLSNFEDIYVTTSLVNAVEMYVLPKNALTPFFLGHAKKISIDRWKYTWDTTQTPNGEFYVYARVKTNYGSTEGTHERITILNEITKTFTPDQEASIDVFVKADEGLQKSVVPAKNETIQPQDITTKEDVIVTKDQPVTFIETLAVEESIGSIIESILNEYDVQLNQKLNDFVKALRANDESVLESIKSEVEAMNNEVLKKIENTTSDEKVIGSVRKYISTTSFDLLELTIKNERVLRERIGDVIITDSDKDDISDYDEINLYKTNPFVADTDGDSYIDSAEIKQGYNPHDSRSEALVAYDSPKEGGIVREDILSIETITALSDSSTEETESQTELPNRAILSGKGLPSSFVTLYIFSTPIVVTVKTDPEGNWTYILDKELEDGSHDVYVGITDNAGRLVAKSNPFAFVKTAEAFTKAEAVSAAIAAENNEPNLLNNSMLLLVASIAVVAIGLVLILLGFHVRDRKLIEPIPA